MDIKKKFVKMNMKLIQRIIQTMIISDDGVGFPENYNISDSDSLGLKIV